MDNYVYRNKARIVGYIELIFAIAWMAVGLKFFHFESIPIYPRDNELLRKVANATKWRQAYQNMLQYIWQGDMSYSLEIGYATSSLIGISCLLAGLVLLMSTKSTEDTEDTLACIQGWRWLQPFVFCGVGFLCGNLALAGLFDYDAITRFIPQCHPCIVIIWKYLIIFVLLRFVLAYIVAMYSAEVERQFGNEQLAQEAAKAG